MYPSTKCRAMRGRISGPAAERYQQRKSGIKKEPSAIFLGGEGENPAARTTQRQSNGPNWNSEMTDPIAA